MILLIASGILFILEAILWLYININLNKLKKCMDHITLKELEIGSALVYTSIMYDIVSTIIYTALAVTSLLIYPHPRDTLLLASVPGLYLAIMLISFFLTKYITDKFDGIVSAYCLGMGDASNIYTKSNKDISTISTISLIIHIIASIIVCIMTIIVNVNLALNDFKVIIDIIKEAI